MRRLFSVLITLLLSSGLFLAADAAQEAEEISSSVAFFSGGLDDYEFLTDGIESESCRVDTELYVRSEEGIASVYLVLDQPCSYVIRDTQTGDTVTGGEEGFLHSFCDLEEALGYAPERIAIDFPTGGPVCEIRLFTSGQVPGSVQRWEQPLNGGADMVLFSTHGDDEQLYFAGLLPYYAGELDLGVQVVYMTSHENICGSQRMHEMLNGLWACGVEAYPVFGPFPDFKLDYREETYLEYEKLGYSRDTLLGYVVENLRRFRPQVAVGHDLNGEYGHGMHKVYADLLGKAVELSCDPESYPESEEAYGVWDVPKTYLHLYKENQITMDWDQPLEHFDGMTAFEVNQKLGFPCHISQQYDQYVYWLYGSGTAITEASQIRSWSPCLYGLLRSTVGEDVAKNDFMENLTTYAEQAAQAEEEAQRLRDTVTQARQQQTEEPQLLRQPDLTQPETQPEPEIRESRNFPTAAAALCLLAIAVSGLLFWKYKKSLRK